MTTETLSLPRSFLGALAHRLVDACVALAHRSPAARCAQEAERLFALSDAELAQRGLTRGRVIQHAFRQFTYL